MLSRSMKEGTYIFVSSPKRTRMNWPHSQVSSLRTHGELLSLISDSGSGWRELDTNKGRSAGTSLVRSRRPVGGVQTHVTAVGPQWATADLLAIPKSTQDICHIRSIK